MTDVVEIIVTGPPEFMPGLLETLVGERLIACGQVTPIDSTYRWQGSIEHDVELRAIMHTTTDRADAVVQRVRDSHPYDVPCILVMAAEAGDADYLGWVRSQTQVS